MTFLATRAIVALAAWLGVSQLPHLYHKGPLTEFALGWDGAWYVGIAQAGYRLAPPPGASNLAFPPLLPLLTHLLGGLLAAAGFVGDDPEYGNWALAGLVISNLAFLLALYVLWHLLTLDHTAAVAAWTLWLLAGFIVGVFWSALYTESLFLLLAAGCLLAARRGRWALAGLQGGLAVLVRWPAIILVGVLLIEWWAARRAAVPQSPVALAGVRRPSWWSLGWIGLIPLALLAYALYVQARFGNFAIVLQARAHLGQSFSFFPLTYAHGLSLLWQSVTGSGPDRDLVLQLGYGHTLYMWLDLALPLVYAGLGILGWRRGWLRPGDLAWLALGIVFPLSTGTTFSLTRYLMPIWPALIVVAEVGMRRPAVARAWLAGSLALLAWNAYLFANEKWIG